MKSGASVTTGLTVYRAMREAQAPQTLAPVGTLAVLALRSDESRSLDSVLDQLGNGRAISVPHILIAYNRETWALNLDTSFSSLPVTRVLD